MIARAVTLRPPRSLTVAARGTAVAALAVLLAGGIADVVVARPRLISVVLAGAVGLALGLVALREPHHAVLALFALLPFLALGRRMLIASAGWHSADPLLLVAPGVALLLLTAARPKVSAGDRLSKAVIAFVALAVLESANPAGGGLLAGPVGLLFVVAPLLWFFVGRNAIDGRTARRLLSLVLVLAPVVALYGIRQTRTGLFSWDEAWLRVSGYQALHVGDVIRAFGTFSSSAEYALYMAIAVVVALAFAMHGRIWTLVIVPLLVWAIFIDSSRGIVVLMLGTTIVLVGMRTRRLVVAYATVAVGLLVVGMTVHTYSGSLNTWASGSGNPLIEHQIGGLTNPLDSQQSTLSAHWHLFVGGLGESLRHPIGLGTGSTNLAGSRFGGVTAGTEVDLSNAFVGLGVGGGVLFVAILGVTLRRVAVLYLGRGDPVLLAASGLLFVTLGQWLNGGYYAVAPLVWLVVGWIESEWRLHTRSRAPRRLSD